MLKRDYLVSLISFLSDAIHGDGEYEKYHEYKKKKWLGLSLSIGSLYQSIVNDNVKRIIVPHQTRFTNGSCPYTKEIIDKSDVVLAPNRVDESHCNIDNVFIKILSLIFLPWVIVKLSFFGIFRLQSRTLHLLCYYELWRVLLRKFGIEKLVLVVAYDPWNRAISAAGRSLNLEVAEVQHGVVNKSHRAYSKYCKSHWRQHGITEFLYWDFMLPYVSDVFGDMVGLHQVEHKSLVRTDSNLKLNSVAIIGQKPYQYILLKLGADLVRRGFEVLYKTHPNETLFSEVVSVVNSLEEIDNSKYKIAVDSTLLLEYSNCSKKGEVLIQLKRQGSFYFDRTENILLLDYEDVFERISKI